MKWNLNPLSLIKAFREKSNAKKGTTQEDLDGLHCLDVDDPYADEHCITLYGESITFRQLNEQMREHYAAQRERPAAEPSIKTTRATE